MRIISNMATTGDMKKLYVYTTPALRAALKRVVLGLAESAAFARRHKYLSQQLVVNATWLMLEDMPAEDLAAKLAPYVARAEAMLTADDPAQTHGPAATRASEVTIDGKPVRAAGVPNGGAGRDTEKRRRRSGG